MNSDEALCGVVIHYGDLASSVTFAKETTERNPDVKLVVVNNGPDDDVSVRNEMPTGVDVLGGGQNRGYGRAANLGIAFAVEHGFDDVVILPDDGHVPAGSLARLQIAAAETSATIAGPLVLYEGSDVIWADGLSFNEQWGIARNTSKGRPREQAAGTRRVQHVTGHCMLLRGCRSRPWLRFDEDLFMYYEDIALCDETISRRELVVATNATAVYHDKPGLTGYRFGRAQERHLARSGLVYWAKHARGVQRGTQLIGFLALTIYRLARSAGLDAFISGLGGIGSGALAASRILRGRRLPPPSP